MAQELVLQQTPSVQKSLDKHSLFAEHLSPRRFWVPQVDPLAQRFGAKQSRSFAQTDLQAVVPLQT